MKRRVCRSRNAAPANLVPVRTSITRIGVDPRVALKNSPDCDDRIPERRSGGNSAAGAAPTSRPESCLEAGARRLA
jgi:hypothetical protein